MKLPLDLLLLLGALALLLLGYRLRRRRPSPEELMARSDALGVQLGAFLDQQKQPPAILVGFPDPAMRHTAYFCAKGRNWPVCSYLHRCSYPKGTCAREGTQS